MFDFAKRHAKSARTGALFLSAGRTRRVHLLPGKVTKKREYFAYGSCRPWSKMVRAGRTRRVHLPPDKVTKKPTLFRVGFLVTLPGIEPGIAP